jgi:hypothetical protein
MSWSSKQRARREAILHPPSFYLDLLEEESARFFFERMSG